MKRLPRITTSELGRAQEEAFDFGRLAEAMGYDAAAKPPKASTTSRDFARRTGVSFGLAKDKFDQLVRSGSMESGKFRDPKTGRGTTYYWWKK